MNVKSHSRGNVIVFKGDDDSNASGDPYLVELSKLSFSTTIIPALKFDFIHLDVLKGYLDSPDKFSGVILSSPRCAQAVVNSGSLSKWKGKHVFTVGSRTASLIRDLNIETLGEECGSASSLAEYILKDFSSLELPLLLPHGNLSLKTLTDSLTKANLKIVEVEVYQTLQNPNLEDSIRNYFDKASFVDFVVFMSPSAVKSCLPLLENHQNLSTIKFVTLGPTTANALAEKSIVPAGVAEKPTPQYLALTMFQLTECNLLK